VSSTAEIAARPLTGPRAAFQLAFADLASAWVVIGFGLLLGVVSGFSSPSQLALVASLVQPRDLGRRSRSTR
jgi:hypothetical protein